MRARTSDCCCQTRATAPPRRACSAPTWRHRSFRSNRTSCGDWRFRTANPGEWRSGPYTVLARELPHKGGRTFGYRVSDGTATIAYMPDHCPTALGAGARRAGGVPRRGAGARRRSRRALHEAHLHGEGELAREGFLGHASRVLGRARQPRERPQRGSLPPPPGTHRRSARRALPAPRGLGGGHPRRRRAK